MKFIFKIIITALAVFAGAYIIPGVHTESFSVALILALVLTVLNVTIKPLLVILTIPITIVTLGLFLLVINALIILLADYLVSGFSVSGFWTALLYSIVVSIMVSIFESFDKD
ncbi:phage holin family protein [Marinigracilibium pacificum]|uniref:Phage holin family protein n=1 Tax=Marinigracilibium pacificum TaxID=2729599 RepID=A0A848J468_9BACT|nr:phage holin family protein [Marinigracilibium pacificum]NMM49320.1 phage holin family protein [Marinigracilibium pacificum]